MISCFISHIGTRILIPLAVFFIDIFTVTTTKCLMDFVGSINSNHICRSRSSITATINLLDAGHITTINDDLRILVRICWLIHGQVTTAIDSKNIVFLISNGFDVIVYSNLLSICANCTRNGSLVCTNLS